MTFENFFSLYEDYLRVDTPNKFWLVNTNKLVRFYEGSDGLKTGFTDAAKYCMAVTAKRDGMRLLAIVLGEDVSKVRNAETTALLDYGFNLYKVNVLKPKGAVIDKIKVSKELKTGMVSCNNLAYSAPYNPFGGTKASGIGRIRGKWGIRELCNIKVIAFEK